MNETNQHFTLCSGGSLHDRICSEILFLFELGIYIIHTAIIVLKNTYTRSVTRQIRKAIHYKHSDHMLTMDFVIYMDTYISVCFFFVPRIYQLCPYEYPFCLSQTFKGEYRDNKDSIEKLASKHT